MAAAQHARSGRCLSLVLVVALVTPLAAAATASSGVPDLRPASLFTQTAKGASTAKGGLFSPEDTAFSAAVRKRQHSEEDDCQAYLLKHQPLSDRYHSTCLCVCTYVCLYPV